MIEIRQVVDKKMRKKKTDYLEAIPVIAALKKRVLNKSVKIKEKTFHSYLKALNHVFPHIKFLYGSFEKFLESDSNDKAGFFLTWVNENENNGKTRNTVLNYIWQTQGFLGKLDKKYKANPELLETMKSSTNLELDLTKEDVMKLYELLPIKHKLILKIMTFTGLNPADRVLLKLSDFKKSQIEDFYYVNKFREKTKDKDTSYILVFHETFYREVKAFCDNHKIGAEEIIFHALKKKEPMKKDSIRDTFNTYIRKYELNPFLKPRYIRQLCFTLLEDVLPEKYLHIWSQHKSNLVTRHYLKKTISKLAGFYDKIAEAVLIGNGYVAMKADEKKSQERMKILEEEVAALKAEKKENKEGFEELKRDLDSLKNTVKLLLKAQK